MLSYCVLDQTRHAWRYDVGGYVSTSPYYRSNALTITTGMGQRRALYA